MRERERERKGQIPNSHLLSKTKGESQVWTCPFFLVRLFHTLLYERLF